MSVPDLSGAGDFASQLSDLLGQVVGGIGTIVGVVQTGKGTGTATTDTGHTVEVTSGNAAGFAGLDWKVLGIVGLALLLLVKGSK